MIEFRNIKYKNIMSTGDSWTSVDLDSHKTTLIVGKNGAGKSTLLDALSFALYGKPFRKITKPQLLNSINRRELLVEVTFSVRGRDYMVRRGIKGNVFEVYCDGKLLNQNAKASEYQTFFEDEILKINHKSFKQIVVLGSSTFVPFMQLSAPERRKIIEDLLDIQVFSTMNVLLKGRVSSNKELLTRLGYEVESKKKEIEAAEKSQGEIQKLQEKRVSQIKERMNEIISTVTEQEEKEKEGQSKIVKILETITDESETGQQHAEHSAHCIRLGSKIDSAKKTVKFFETNDSCPTCEQELAPDFKSNRLETEKSNLSRIEAELEEKEASEMRLRERLAEIKTAHEESHQIQKTISNLRFQIKENKNRLKQLAAELKSIKKDTEDAVDQSSIDSMKGELKRLKADLNEALEQKKVLSAAATLLKDGGIKAQVVKQYVPIINKLVNQYLSAMDFFVDFHLDEEFNETIKSRHRDEFSYESFSEGEKMRINLALLFTWRAVSKMRNSMSTNILLFDEIFDSSLDGEGADDLIEIFKQLSDGSNIIVISHNRTGLQEKFERVIYFDKHKNFSRMEILE